MTSIRHLILILLISVPTASAADLHLKIPAAAPLASTAVARAVNRSIGGIHVAARGCGLLIAVETSRLPSTIAAIKKSTRTFTAILTPKATAAQAKQCGLFLPDHVDAAKPLVVLIHGVDMERSDLADLAKPLTDAGMQVGYFQYLPDQPIADDVAALASVMTDLHRTTPTIHLDLVGYSMGGLVARGYLEGDRYAGGVDRLIMLATPNHGSDWASLVWVTKTEQQIDQARHDKDWHPSWAITGGLCEAGEDLKAGSKFLTALNARPRRAGVVYTIVAGDRSPIRRVVAAAIDAPQALIPETTRSTVWFQLTRFGVKTASAIAVDPDCDADGPVKLTSARLDGVDDFVVVHADHQTMIRSENGTTPAAAGVLLARLEGCKVARIGVATLVVTKSVTTNNRQG